MEKSILISVLHEHLGESWANLLSARYWKIFKTRNTDLQIQSPGHGWQKSKKKEKKKNTGICKALCVSRKRRKQKYLIEGWWKKDYDALKYAKNHILDCIKKDYLFENLTEDEYEAFLNLKNNKNIII